MTARLRALSLAACAALIPLPAFSQAPAPAAPPAPASEPIEDITITAERRESTVQDTAISISAFDDDAMKRQGIASTADLHLHVPGFFYTEGGGNSPITQIAIRGVGNENVTTGGDPGVAYHFDGVYLSRPTAAAAQLFDAERIEVLRGPQGTLYGRNATGGSINVVSKKPTEEWDALADFGYGNYSQVRARVAGGGPLTDWLKFRVAAVRESHDPFLENVAPNSFCPGKCNDIDEQDVWAFRTHLLLEPTEGTDVLFTVQYYWDDGAAGQYRDDSNTFATSPLPPTGDKRKIRQDLDTELDLESKLFTLRLDQDLELGPLGPMRLSSFISYQEQEWTQIADNDFSEQPWSFTDWTEPTDQWTGEIQLASAGDSRFSWMVGFFALQEDAAIEFLFIDENPAVFPFRFQSFGFFDTRSYGGFAEGSLELAPVTLRLGLRYSSDEKRASTGLCFMGAPTFAPPFPDCDSTGLATPLDPTDDFTPDRESNKWHRLTGRFVAEYRPTDELMFFGSVSKGYKSGGILGANPLFQNIYGPEDIWAYEVGAKTRWFEDRLQANVAAYFNDYDDLQVFILSGFGANIENAATAKVGGIELELVTIPFDALQLDVTAAWSHAEYTEYDSADPVPAGLGGATTTDQSGNRLNRTPEWAVNVGGQYGLRLGESTLTPRFDWHYQSEVFFRPYGLDRDRSPAWDQWNLRVTWDAPPTDAGQFSVELYVTNVENNDHIMNLSVGAGSELFPEQGNLHPPRLYGFRIGWEY